MEARVRRLQENLAQLSLDLKTQQQRAEQRRHEYDERRRVQKLEDERREEERRKKTDERTERKSSTSERTSTLSSTTDRTTSSYRSPYTSTISSHSMEDIPTRRSYHGVDSSEYSSRSRRSTVSSTTISSPSQYNSNSTSSQYNSTSNTSNSSSYPYTRGSTASYSNSTNSSSYTTNTSTPYRSYERRSSTNTSTSISSPGTRTSSRNSSNITTQSSSNTTNSDDNRRIRLNTQRNYDIEDTRTSTISRHRTSSTASPSSSSSSSTTRNRERQSDNTVTDVEEPSNFTLPFPYRRNRSSNEDDEEEDGESQGWEKGDGATTQYCSILCMDTSNWVKTKCGHYFDAEAFETWINQPDGPDSCPICRTPFKIFDKKRQQEIAHELVLSYVNNIAMQYHKLWLSDNRNIINRFWEEIGEEKLVNLIDEFEKPNSTINIQSSLRGLLEEPLKSYHEKLQKAVHDIVRKDIQSNLKFHIPLRYQSQVDKDVELYMQYSLTTLVPEFYIKWWKKFYYPHIYQGIEELFLMEI
eukprot:TRINITY_DN1062_c0_g1_i2.p1 TRINITY_DN1062_c0_g1~~TRINITY_DN1062_c0_g1_i2.p1  ORF type:complete len:526 (-),score=126.05 TRINITY_DN1062_c0_g1_i2:167-1744(-)